MLYKIDYTESHWRKQSTRYVNFAEDQVDAVTRFMKWFYTNNEGNSVRLDCITAIEFTGDMSSIAFIDEVFAEEAASD